MVEKGKGRKQQEEQVAVCNKDLEDRTRDRNKLVEYLDSTLETYDWTLDL